MPLSEYVNSALGQEKMTLFEKAILDHCKNLVDMSRRKMTQYYDKWDEFEMTYRAKKVEDKQDRSARNRKEPSKMVIPTTHAQIQTFAAFGYAVYTQREFFYELLGMSPEGQKAARYAEAALQRDLDHNKFNAALYQFLIDCGRFGLGIFKNYWVEEKQFVDESIPARQLSFLGMSFNITSRKSNKVERVKYQGNKIVNISPYRFFPDPRVSISRFQEGEFVASEDEMTHVDLKQLEHEGTVKGVQYIPQMARSGNPDRKDSRLFNVDFANDESKIMSTGQSKGTYVITEVQVKLIPKEFELEEGKTLGPEDYPVKYLVWYANDSRVIRVEPLNYIHDRFTYELAEITPDMNRFICEGLADLVDQLQDVISWLINSHITSVRKVISNFLVVDPEAVVLEDLKERRPVIRLKPGAARSGIDRWIQQLAVNDVTQNHIADAEVLLRFIQLTTGINENLLGQFHTGRRSATEARNVSSSAAARLKMIVSNMFVNALEPLGRQMLSNLRDGLTQETFVRMFGSDSDPMDFMALKRVTRSDLVGDYDFQVFDGTLPSEKSYIADTLVEVLTATIANPNAIPLLGMDPKLLLYEVLRLKGVRYPQRFALANPALAMQTLALLQGQAQQQQQGNGNNEVSNGAGQTRQNGATDLNSRLAQASGNELSVE